MDAEQLYERESMMKPAISRPSTTRAAVTVMGYGQLYDGDDVLIDPTLAEKILKRNVSNRGLRKAAVERYASDMAEGRWNDATGQPITIHTSGTVIDGQHRLHAVCKSGASQNFRLVVTDDISVGACIDNNLPRTAVDFSRYLGLDFTVTNAVAACGRCMWLGGSTTTTMGSKLELLDFIGKHHEAIAFTCKLLPSHMGRGLITAAIRAAFSRAYYYAEEGELTRCAQLLLDGVPPDDLVRKGDRSIIALRTYMMRPDYNQAGGRRAQATQYKKATRAIAAYLNGEDFKKTSMVQEELFPLPTIAD